MIIITATQSNTYWVRLTRSNPKITDTQWSYYRIPPASHLNWFLPNTCLDNGSSWFGPVTGSISGMLPIERIGPATWPVQLGDLFGLKHYDLQSGQRYFWASIYGPEHGPWAQLWSLNNSILEQTSVVAVEMRFGQSSHNLPYSHEILLTSSARTSTCVRTSIH